MADRNEHNPEHDPGRGADEQLYRGSSTLLKLGNLSWTHRLLLDQVEALSGRKLNEAEKSASHEKQELDGRHLLEKPLTQRAFSVTMVVSFKSFCTILNV